MNSTTHTTTLEAINSVIAIRQRNREDTNRRRAVNAISERLEVLTILSGGTINPRLIQKHAQDIVAQVVAELRG